MERKLTVFEQQPLVPQPMKQRKGKVNQPKNGHDDPMNDDENERMDDGRDVDPEESVDVAHVQDDDDHDLDDGYDVLVVVPQNDEPDDALKDGRDPARLLMDLPQRLLQNLCRLL